MFKLFTQFASHYQDYVPKSITCLREGYSKQFFFNDLIAGVTVGIISLPLAMAFAIASGLPPERGLFTAVVAGFLISLLGGSRVQIGGPTGAYVVIVYSVVQRHGYEGLALATILAGLLLIVMGLTRCGVLLKFIPYPVTTGFTSGIALSLFSGQIKDFFGLKIPSLPAHFLEKWHLYIKTAATWSPLAFYIGIASLAIIFFMRRFVPRVPGAILAVLLATLVVAFLDLPVDTIEKKFGEIPRTLPLPSFPLFSIEKIQAVFPDAITIALLGAIESLLSALIADGMTGHRHRSNGELVAQGFANIGSIIFGGIPATGAIARTAANINLHAKTPVAGMLHAITVLLIMLFFAPFASKIPLPALAAVLIYVAWNMSEVEHFIDILKGPRSDAVVLVITFLATVLIDLTVATQVGIVLSAILFLKRMTNTTSVNVCKLLLKENAHEHPEKYDSDIIFRDDIPREVAVFEINGPFFFGVADLLNEELRQLIETPKFFILRMRKVPMIDATGIKALKQFAKKCHQRNIVFLISGVREELKAMIVKSGVEEAVGQKHFFRNLDEALAYSKIHLEHALFNKELQEV